MARIGRRAALLCIVAVVGVHVYFELAHCQSGRLSTPFYIAAIVLAPAVLFALISRPFAAVAACLVVVGPVIWAYRAECVLPYEGGGAAMAFVPVILFALPVALVLGALVEGAARE